MDFQNRPGGKTGGGGVASWSESNRDRRERLRQLALETIDLNKDPYFMKNHLGSYECKLCLTLHNNEGSYLAHTQGKKHQANLARRAAKEAKEAPQQLAPEKPRIEPKKFVKIGRPGYRVTKQKDPENGQQSLLFQVDYPEIAEGVQPRHRFMSAYEQKIEPPDRRWQYLLFAAEPYETIAFKVPSREVEKHDSKFWTHWNKDTKQFFLQFAFKMEAMRMPPPPPKMWENHGMRLPPPPGAPLMGVPPPLPFYLFPHHHLQCNKMIYCMYKNFLSSFLFSALNLNSSRKNQTKPCTQKQEVEKPKSSIKAPTLVGKTKPINATKSYKVSSDTQSQCSSSAHSVKSFATPKPLRPVLQNNKIQTSLKKSELNGPKIKKEIQCEILKAQEVEIRNKDHTIAEYTKQIEEFKNKIQQLEKQLEELNSVNKIDEKLAQLSIQEGEGAVGNNETHHKVNELKERIFQLEQQCESLEQEVSDKQLELRSVEEVITIRDSLCQDLQQKLTTAERDLEETNQRLEMVKGHHALALEANESIRREYKVELETLKTKLEEEKQAILNKSKSDQEMLRTKHTNLLESIKNQLIKEKNEAVQELQLELINKEKEMKAKLDQIEEATHEKLRLCEIQFEERSQNIHEHYTQQLINMQSYENEIRDLKYNIALAEEEKIMLQKEIKNLKYENDSLTKEKHNLTKERDEIKEESKRKLIDFENEINRLTVEVERVHKEKNKFETSLTVTRDIVQVLTMRLRESDNELELLEDKIQTLTNSNEILESELNSYKTTLNNTVMECNEYKEALVNILKSKAALAKEHNRIMEHNVSLIESLQNVEKEAYRELGSIKNELIEDVELLKMESTSQIKFLRDEIEKKRVLCELATEHAGQATAAAEQSRVLLAQAAAEINRLEAENKCLQQQIQDQQSVVVELSLLRQENEELSMTVAKQSSIIDKMKKDCEHLQFKPKSPSVMRKTSKIGKENIQTVISPLRERNH